MHLKHLDRHHTKPCLPAPGPLRRLGALRKSFGFCIAVFATSGCLVELSGEEGRFWCVEAVGANGTRQQTNLNVNIVKGADWITGCAPTCLFEDEVLQQGADDMIGPLDPLYPQWQDLLDRVALYGESACVGRVNQLAADNGPIVFTGSGDITCGAAVAAQEVYRGDKMLNTEEFCAPDTGSTGGGGDSTTGSDVTGPGHYGLTTYNEVRSCTTSTSSRTISCSIDQEFVRDLASDYLLIWTDDAALVAGTGPGGVQGVRFGECASSSLLYALGFRLNDLIVSVDDIPFTDFEDGQGILGQLGAVSYTGTPAKVKFYRGTQLWTLTANRTNFSTYP